MRENPDLRPAFGFLDKSVFQANLGIAPSISELLPARQVEARPGDEMEHGVGRETIIDLKMRRRPGIVEAIPHLGRGDIELPMSELDGIGIVGKKRRAAGDGKDQDEKTGGRSGNRPPKMRSPAHEKRLPSGVDPCQPLR